MHARWRDPQDAHDVVVRVLLGEQPLPLKVSEQGEKFRGTRLNAGFLARVSFRGGVAI